MTLSTSRQAYRPYYDLLDQALQSNKGLRVRVRDRGAGNQLRIRLNMARALDRDLARETYELGDKRFGVSIYDPLIVKVEPDGDDIVVVIEPNSLVGEVEEIT